MSIPPNVPDAQSRNNDAISDHPTHSSHGHHFLIPSPVPTRRTRTMSHSERAAREPLQHGIVKEFCRQKGHGFIIPSDGIDLLFVHISDIEGEYVPKPGDEVTFRATPIPPSNKKMQAVHTKIVHLNPGVVHEKWDSPVAPQ